MPIVSVQEITKIFGELDGAVTAVDRVSLELEPGSWTAIMGPSGCGKSTLLNILGGLQAPTAGRVYFAGQDVTAMSDDELHAYRREHVGFVFQDFNLIPMLTAAENVALPLELAGRRHRDAMSVALRFLETVDIGELADRFPSTLSGGQRQRVAVARAVAGGQTLLLADEPTGALDSRSVEGLMKLFAGLGDEVTRVVVTHDAAVAAHADRVVWMRDGQIAQPEE